MKKLLLDAFLTNKEKLGKVSSWAVWENRSLGDYDSAVNTLNEIDSQSSLDSLNLNPNIVILALNFADRTEDDLDSYVMNFQSFHEHVEGVQKNDDKLKAICVDNNFLGAYLTDLVKYDEDGKPRGYRNSNSQEVGKKLRKDSNYESVQINNLIQELLELGVKNPLIISLGDEVKKSIQRNKQLLQSELGPDTNFKFIYHYSYRHKGNHDIEVYKQTVRKQLMR
ncbi:hypothetical protein ACFSN5_00400 [Streptococcus tangpeifui]|uniref:hypothetical protein n=1 Tax=Streptococcus tangpeifui TaxID=2709400 RepID=UPI0013EDC290|nr:MULTISPECIES: hypothetical protein [unclassified Streptococcus]